LPNYLLQGIFTATSESLPVNLRTKIFGVEVKVWMNALNLSQNECQIFVVRRGFSEESSPAAECSNQGAV